MIEIERKFWITADQKTHIKELIESRYGVLKRIRQIDEVFLQGIDSFKDFTPDMPVMRLRTQDNSTQLTYKRCINEAGDSMEHELSIGSPQAMRAILHEMDYRSVTFVDKVRSEVASDNLAIMIDEVNGLGDFVEIEILADDKDDVGKHVLKILQIAAQLGLGEDSIEVKKYDQLVAQKKN